MKLVNRLIFLLSIFGLLVSGYLLEKYLTGGKIACGQDAGCDVVRDSAYSVFLGVPIPAYGLVFYVIILILSFIKTIFIKYEHKINVLLILSSAVGLVVSLYLLYLELFVIHAICLWCTGSGIISLAIFLLCLRFLKFSGKESNP